MTEQALEKKDKVRSYYEKEAVEYDTQFYLEDNSYPTLRYRHNYMLGMVADADLPDDARVLDIGCGPGEMVIDLVRKDWEIHGIDIAADMIERAEGRLARRRDINNKIILGVGDIEKLNYPDKHFDLIICSGVIEYLKDDVAWLKEINRVLKSGGYLVINVTNKFAIRKWTAPIFELFKRSKAIYNLLNWIKSKVLKKGKLHYFPFKPRVHSPGGYDRFMEKAGYEKVYHNYFDFSVAPAPLDTLLTPIKKWMERFSRKNMVLNGVGYIVMFRRK